jgi:uncharacterized membrane protein
MINPNVIFTVVVLSVLVLILSLLALRHRNQQMLHEERVAALEKGTAVPVRSSAPWTPRIYLLRGLIWSFSGVAVLVCLFGLAVASHRPASAESMLWSAKNLSRTVDIPLDEARRIVEQDRAKGQEGVSPAVALLGLIPLAVGLAYVVFYYTDESRKRAPAEGGQGSPTLSRS